MKTFFVWTVGSALLLIAALFAHRIPMLRDNNGWIICGLLLLELLLMVNVVRSK